MRPRRSVNSDRPLTLPGGTEDNDLWIEIKGDGNDNPVLCTVWQPSAEERERIAKGENIELQVWGAKHPPVNVNLTDIDLKGVDRDTDIPAADLDFNDWPTAEQVVEVLGAAWVRENVEPHPGACRTMAELAGSLQCPDFSHLQPALDQLIASGAVERRRSQSGASLYRLSRPLTPEERKG